MSNYILIESKKARASIFASKDKTKDYVLEFNGKRICMDFFIESWFLTILHDPIEVIAARKYIRKLLPGIQASDLEGLIRKFKTDHPLEELQKYSYKDIPCIATSDTYCEMKSEVFKKPIRLNLQQEQELLDIIRIKRLYGKSKLSLMMEWFTTFRHDNACWANFRCDKDYKDRELALLFCLCHGVSFRKIKQVQCEFVNDLRTAGVAFVFLMYVFLGFYLITLDSWFAIIVGLLIFASAQFIWEHGTS